jgi:hypothetical protein
MLASGKAVLSGLRWCGMLDVVAFRALTRLFSHRADSVIIRTSPLTHMPLGSAAQCRHAITRHVWGVMLSCVSGVATAQAVNLMGPLPASNASTF